MEVEWFVRRPNTLGFRIKDPEGEIKVFMFNVSLEIIVLIFLIIIYTSIVICSILRRKSMQQESEEQKKSRRRENCLTVVAAVLSVSIAIFASFSVCILMLKTQSAPQWLLTYLFAPEHNFFHYLMTYVVGFAAFVFNFSNPYILLVMSPMIRRSCLEALHIDKYFYGDKTQSSTTTTSLQK